MNRNNINNYTLLYSNRCMESKNIVDIINKNGVNTFINTECIDSMSREDLIKLSAFVSHFPSLAITRNGITEWKVGPEECEPTINGLITNRRAEISNMTESRMNAINQAQRNIKIENDGPNEYNECEMEGMSDSYSYTNNDMAQPKQFMTPEQEENMNIVTLQNDNERVLNKRDTDRYMNQLAQDRKKDMENCRINMEREIIANVMRNS